MLRNLLDEVRRRHLWPIPVIALLVAVAAPLLFLKSAPSDAPLASAPAPVAAPAGQLPARALLATSDTRKRAARERSRKADPFQGPSSAAAKVAAKKTSSDKKTSTAPEPVPVVITNPDGTAPATPTTPATPAAPIGGDDAPTKVIPQTRPMIVNVRFGARIPAPLSPVVPRLQTFSAGGRVVAIFVKYSPARDKAVFAIAPDSLLSGDIDCRRKDGVCRYVDIPAGKGVRLTVTTSAGTLVTRRLDVESINPLPDSSAPSGVIPTPVNGPCLLGKLLALSPGDASLATDACGD
jgi:hypothetical protein